MLFEEVRNAFKKLGTEFKKLVDEGMVKGIQPGEKAILLPSGELLCFQDWDTNPEGTDYVRLVNPGTGEETTRWACSEWMGPEVNHIITCILDTLDNEKQDEQKNSEIRTAKEEAND